MTKTATGKDIQIFKSGSLEFEKCGDNSHVEICWL